MHIKKKKICCPNPQPSEWGLLWKQGLHRGDQVILRPVGWALIQHDGCPYEAGNCGHRHLYVQLPGVSMSEAMWRVVCSTRCFKAYAVHAGGWKNAFIGGRLLPSENSRFSFRGRRRPGECLPGSKRTRAHGPHTSRTSGTREVLFPDSHDSPSPHSDGISLNQSLRPSEGSVLIGLHLDCCPP